MGNKHAGSGAFEVYVDTMLEIYNKTNTDIIQTEVTGIDNYDWDGNERPDKNFQGVFIGAGQSVSRHEHVNDAARRCPFTMTLHFRDGTRDKFRIHQKWASWFLDEPDSNFQHIEVSHKIDHERIDYKILITVSNTYAQLRNEKAKEMNKDGEEAMRQQQFETAKKIFDEALTLANEYSTASSIESNKSEVERLLRNRKAEAINSQGKEAINQNDYETALKKFEEALTVASEASTISSIKRNKTEVIDKIQNQKSEEKNQEGEAAMKQKQYQTALQKFEEALSLANESSTASSIKRNKTRAYNQIGNEYLQEAWNLEADTTQDGSQEARRKFDAAWNMFRRSENETNLKLVELKISGNRLFNKANEMEAEAFELFANSSYVLTQTKYQEALAKYEAAKKKFEEGLKLGSDRFDGSVKIVDDAIEGVKKTVQDVQKMELSVNISLVVENEKVGGENEADQKTISNKHVIEGIEIE